MKRWYFINPTTGHSEYRFTQIKQGGVINMERFLYCGDRDRLSILEPPEYLAIESILRDHGFSYVEDKRDNSQWSNASKP